MTAVKMAHNGDLASSGLCLMEKGWFGNEETGFKKGRMSIFVVYSICVNLVKVVSVWFFMKAYIHYNNSNKSDTLELFELQRFGDLN